MGGRFSAGYLRVAGGEKRFLRALPTSGIPRKVLIIAPCN
jgi:hypothetical protein